MIVSVGEILFDVYAEKTESGYSLDAKIGGAPYNLARAVNKFGGKSGFVGCVGNDIFGDRLFEMTDSKVFSELLLTRDMKRNTPLALVRNSRGGERSFTFFGHDASDLYPPQVPLKLLKKARIVHIGSLLLRTKRGLTRALKLADKAHANRCLVSFDVNYRPALFPDRKTAKEAIKEILTRADLIKFSEDELNFIGEDFISALPDSKLVCVTLGENGSMYRYNGLRRTAPSIKVTPSDTTGAGDAFWAGALTRLDSVKTCDWTEDFLKDTLTFANVCGALTTLRRGAVEALPTLEEIKKALPR